MFSLGTGYAMILLGIQFSTAELKSDRFIRRQDFDNHTCQINDEIFTGQTVNVISCLSLCAEAVSCQSVFFNKKEQKCIGCKVKYHNATRLNAAAGFQYYYTEKGKYKFGM